MESLLLIIGIIIVGLSSVFIYKESNRKDNNQREFEKMYTDIEGNIEKSEEILKKIEILTNTNLSLAKNNSYLDDDITDRTSQAFQKKMEEKLNSPEKKIIDLANYGYTADEIAKKLRLGKREVRIILKMNGVDIK